MTNTDKVAKKSKKAIAAEEKAERLAEQLRNNLRRRKAQTRSRDNDSTDK